MKQEQFDIFGAVESKPKAKSKKSKKKSDKKRDVRKAPMILDSFIPDEKQTAKTHRPNLGKEKPIADEIIDSVGGLSEVAKVDEKAGPKIYTVTEITENIKGVIEGRYPDVWIAGEITDFKGRNSRHFYFALKDANKNKIRAIIWNGGARNLKFDLTDGLEVICHGNLNVYGPGGYYSVIIDYMEPKGVGALQIAFEQLKKKLEAEGLFERGRKKQLPFMPRRIGVITSPTGAAIKDIVGVLTRRFPNIEVLISPVRVQGEGAAPEIARAIDEMNEIAGLDLLIVGRGGGSMEDLWCFNEEIVARAIARSNCPIISAVGHEIDYTIADFVADVRAATPSAAAEIAVPVKSDMALNLKERHRQLSLALKQSLFNKAQELAKLSARLKGPERRLPDLMRGVDSLRERLLNSIKYSYDRRRQQIEKLVSNLNHLSPLGILAKGYSVAESDGGSVVKSVEQIRNGDLLNLRFHKGSAQAKITKIID